MSSTNICVGLNESRNSSRVLRPPGGGNSDILGLTVPYDATNQAKKPSPRNVSSILEGTNNKVDEIKTPPVVKTVDEQPKAVPETVNNKEVKSTERVRVPPGGFSSGLW